MLVLGRALLVLLLALVAPAGCATLGSRAETAASSEPGEEWSGPMRLLDVSPEEFLRRAEGIYVVVDLDTNRLRLMDGRQALWEAPVGTGTGLRLRSESGEWHFTTPRGVFQIQLKEELPVWILPDWYFVKKGMPVPPENSPLRRAPGQLGAAAVYLGEEIAIHGTDRPELLGQRVSHGCIRLENRYAQRLFHNVQVGTPVVIVGGEHLDRLPPAELTDPGKPGVDRRDPLAGVSTTALLERLERSLARPDTSTDWVAFASRLITRGLKDDADALRGVLRLAGKAGTDRLNREYATFLADAFARGSLRTVVSLARIEEEARQRAARAIVEATMELHVTSPHGPAAPWPTRRVPSWRLGPDGQKGWSALRAAEEAYAGRSERLVAEGSGRP